MEPAGSSLGWNSVDQLLFAWLDQPEAKVQDQLQQLRQHNPTLAEALAARLQNLRLSGFAWRESGPRPGTTFGDYRIHSQLGVGGMGAVYLAQQLSLDRAVALKVIRSERMQDAAARERFRREARAVANLRHPGICAVLEVGEVENAPFLAMQYVEGETLAARIAARRTAAASQRSGSQPTGPTTQPEIHATLALVEQVAEALHEAHEAGVVHRDVKPGNIMIDRQGRPVLLDFGLAREESRPDADAALTVTGELLGTPAYMSPEQVRPRGPVDRRTDVYSLAATLYECLTLQRPFAGANQLELYERIERDPTPDPRRSNPHLPADITSVLARAMEKEPARRYASALEFAAELQRIRKREPVRARRIGAGQRLWRWSRRNPLAALLVLALAGGLCASGLWLQQTRSQRDAIAELAETSRVQGLLGAAATELDSNPTTSLLLADAADRARPSAATLEQLRVSLLHAATQLAVLVGHRHYVMRSLLSADGAVAVTGAYDGTVRVWDRLGSERRSFEFGTGEPRPKVCDLDWLRDGEQVLCATEAGEVFLLDLVDGAKVQLAKVDGAVLRVRVLADGRIAFCGYDGCLHVIEPDGRMVRSYQHGSPVWVIAPCPRHPGLLATTDYAGIVRIFDLTNPADSPRFQTPVVKAADVASFSPNRDELLVADYAGNVRLFDLDGNELLSRRHGPGDAPVHVFDATWTPDGERFLTVGADGRGCLWQRDGRLVSVFPGHTGEIYCAAVTAAGDYWATGSEDGTVRLWTTNGEPFATLIGHSGSISGGLHFNRDGSRLLSASTDCTARFWDLSIEGLPVLQSRNTGVLTAQFVPDSDEILTTNKSGLLEFWGRDGRSRGQLPAVHGYAGSVVFDRTAAHVVLGQQSGFVAVVELATRKITASWKPQDPLDQANRMVAVTPDGRVLLVSHLWGNLQPSIARTDLQLRSPQVLALLPKDLLVQEVCLDPSGERLYLACGDGSIRTYSTRGELLRIAVEPTGNGIVGLCVSPDGRLLGAGGTDRTVRLYEVQPDGGLRLRHEMHGHQSQIGRVRFSPDSQRLVTCSHDPTTRIWSIDGTALDTIRGHTGFVYDATFSADGKVLVTAGSEGLTRLWHANPEDLRAAARAHIHRDLDAEELQRYGHLLSAQPR